MKFENVEIFNIEGALRGMRNPKDSWGMSDSFHPAYNEGYKDWNVRCYRGFYVGDSDLKLAQRLIGAGNEHRKFLRQIFVSVDITAPLYWWKEFDTYKVGTVSNSCSTMHKIQSNPITLDMFELDETMRTNKNFGEYIQWIESLRVAFNDTKDKIIWRQLIQALPESWLQKRTITINYENLHSMYLQRRYHKLSEWSDDFMRFIDILPLTEEFIKYDSQEA